MAGDSGGAANVATVSGWVTVSACLIWFMPLYSIASHASQLVLRRHPGYQPAIAPLQHASSCATRPPGPAAAFSGIISLCAKHARGEHQLWWHSTLLLPSPALPFARHYGLQDDESSRTRKSISTACLPYLFWNARHACRVLAFRGTPARWFSTCCQPQHYSITGALRTLSLSSNAIGITHISVLNVAGWFLR